MSKVAAVELTDLHLEDDTVNICIDVVKQIIALAIKHNVKIILNGGDTFNSRKVQSMMCLQAFEVILDLIYEAGLHMYAIDGNHDKVMYNSAKSYMDPFKHHPALTLIKTYEVGVHVDGELTISMLSFFSDNNQCTSNEIYVKYLKDMARKSVKTKYHHLISHHGVDGAKSNSGRPIESDISMKLFDPFTSVDFGHYHDRNELSKKIHYIGAAKQSWFSEAKEKGFVLLYDNGTREYVQSIFKQYTELDCVLTDDYVQKVADTVKKLKTKYKDDYQRIHLIGDKASIKSIDINAIKSAGIDVRKTDITNPVEQDGEHEDFRYVKFEESDMPSLLMEFLDEEGIVDDAEIEYAVDILSRTMNK